MQVHGATSHSTCAAGAINQPLNGCRNRLARDFGMDATAVVIHAFRVRTLPHQPYTAYSVGLASLEKWRTSLLHDLAC